jgi:hypothetical protein
MIRRDDLVQGSQEWLQARLGIPTASSFDKILSPKKLQPSTQAIPYRNQLVAEWLLGYPLELGNNNGWMDRGTGMEAEARAWYELRHDVDVDMVGFILRDDEKVGGSPDALVGDDGGVDFKCPGIHTHIGYVIDPKQLAEKYHAQMQGYLYLTERAWWDIVSYHPVLPKVEVRIERDDKYIGALHAALNVFVLYLDEVKRQLSEYKYQPEAVAI